MKQAATTRWLLVLAALLPVGTPQLYGAHPVIRTLILSGQNNHNWKETTPLLQRLLTASRQFSVEVTEHPEQCPPETFARYDLVLSNWNSLGPVKHWPEPTLAALLDSVRRGGGFVVVHSGGTMFLDSPGFQKLIGATWGPHTGHGAKHNFEVRFVDANHPITRGLAPFHTSDELWHRMLAQPDKQILATAFSAPDKGGSGADEPVAMITRFGKGRCFNLVLGHDVQAMETPAFQTLLLRGAQWAATGQVTIVAAGDSADPDELLRSLAAYHFGDSRADMVAMQKLVGSASCNPAKSRLLAAKLSAVLDSDHVSDECREFACRQLGLIGTPAEVPALARRLSDAKLGLLARFALERIPGEESLAALREALPAARGPARLGIISALGARGDSNAVPLLAGLLSGADVESSAAAMRALGRIGGSPAAQGLIAAETRLPAALRARSSDALLRCAEGLRAAGETGEAAVMFETLTAADRPRAVRIAAFIGWVRSQGDKGGAAVLAALASRDPVLQAAGVRALRAVTSEALLEKLAQRLDSLPSLPQAQVIALLAERGVRGALPAVAQAVTSKDPAVKDAALAAVGLLGDATCVPLLARQIDGSEESRQKIIGESLARLRGPGVDEALCAAIAKMAPMVQRELIRALAARGAKGAVSALLSAAEGPDAGVRREAIAALGKLADTADGPRVIRLLDAKTADSAAVHDAVVAIYSRADDPTPVIAAMQQATGEKKAALVAMVGSLGGEKSLRAVRLLLPVADADVRTAAVRALADWPDAAPLDDLLAVAGAAPSMKCKLLALRGIARLAPLAKDRPAPQVAALLAKALGLAGRPDEIKGLLSALAGVPGPDGLKIAAGYLNDPALKEEAALALAKIAQGLGPQHQAQVAAAMKQVQAIYGSAVFFATSEAIPAGENLALGGKAANLDGLRPDGQSGPPDAAIDGDPKTYWDETDNQKLYWLRVTLKRRGTVRAVRIMGFSHQHYAPRDFEIICDGKVVKRIVGAIYQNNLFGVNLTPTACSTVELKITGVYGPSPGIRELEIIGENK
jgi:type 1 glutamine amidotransferase/HEAT repeat protein